MTASHSAEYSFVPKSWVLPDELTNFQQHCKEMKRKGVSRLYIVKLLTSESQAGMKLCLHEDDCLTTITSEQIPAVGSRILQEYIDKPLLISGYKSHIRLYVLITGADPLRLFVYQDAVIHLATEKYLSPAEGNLENRQMHMTTMQKENRQEDDDDDDGVDYRHRRRLYDERPRQSKLTLGQLLSNMDPSAAAVLWDSLVDLVVKTVLVAQPHLYQSYRLCRVGKSVAAGGTSTKKRSVCFEILGFDVIIDRSLRPFLLEVVRSPSFAVVDGDDVDYDVKAGVIENTLRILNFGYPVSQPKREMERSLEALNQLDVSESENTTKQPGVSDASHEEALSEMIRKLRADAAAQKFADDCGRFQQIFPPGERPQLDKYMKLLETACSLYKLSFDAEQKQEIQRFLVQKEKEGLEVALQKDKGKGNEVEKSKSQRAALDQKVIAQTLAALNDARITYPGKSEKAAEYILDKIHDKWKLHKPLVAAYWFIRLDNSKQTKVVDVVRQKVREIATKTWKRQNVEHITLYRAFQRLFNRLLSNRGQGLWDCLIDSSSWETMFTRSTERLSGAELACCRRVVQLCRDCLLTVYCCSTNAAALNKSPLTTPRPWMTRSSRPGSSRPPTRTLLASSIG